MIRVRRRERRCAEFAVSPLFAPHSQSAAVFRRQRASLSVNKTHTSASELADPNMHADYLGKLTSIGVNKAAYKSVAAEIYNKYVTKFGKDAAPATN